MTTTRFALLTVPAVLLFATAAAAQTVTSIASRSATNTYIVGDAQFGASAQVDASARRELTRTSLRGLPIKGVFAADVDAATNVLFRDRSYPVVGAVGDATLTAGLGDSTLGTTWEADAAVRLAGFTIYTKEASGQAGANFSLWSMDRTASLFDVTASYPVMLGLTADLRFRASLGLKGSLGLTVDPVAMGVGLGSSFEAGATGTASLALSAWCLDVGIATDLRLLNTTVKPTLKISNANGFEGGFEATCAAVRILVRLFWSACGIADDSYAIYDRSFGSVTTTKVLQ